MGLGMDMSRDELLEDRAAFIAGEIGGAVVELIIDGVVIDRDAMVDQLEAMRTAVGYVSHKGLLRVAAEFVRKGHSKPGAVAGLIFAFLCRATFQLIGFAFVYTCQPPR